MKKNNSVVKIKDFSADRSKNAEVENNCFFIAAKNEEIFDKKLIGDVEIDFEDEVVVKNEVVETKVVENNEVKNEVVESKVVETNDILFSDEDDKVSFEGLEYGYFPLGIRGTENIVFSKYRNMPISLSSSEFSKTSVINNFGFDFLEKFAVFSKKGIKSYNMTRLQVEMVNSCVMKGVFSDDDIKGAGIFLDPIDKGHLIINTRKIWGTSKKFNGKRVYGDVVFTADKDLNFNKDTECATKEEINRVFDCFRTWNFVRGDQDRKLIFGWFLCGFLSGALEWRTHCSVTGEKGSGKSTMADFIKAMYRNFASVFDGGSSEAGIRQELQRSSKVLLLDETESENKGTDNLLNMIRTASSGGTVAKGTADQKGVSYELRFSAFMAQIVQPNFKPADLSRIIVFKMNKRKETGGYINPDLIDTDFQKYVGIRLAMIVVSNFEKFNILKKEINMLLATKYGADGRYRTNNSSVIAASIMVLELWDGEKIRQHTEDDINEFLKEFDFKKEIEDAETSDEEDLLKELLNINLNSDLVNNDIVLNHIFAYHGMYNYNLADNIKINKSEIKMVLGKKGIRTDIDDNGDIVVYFDCSDSSLRKELKNSKFQKGDIRTVLMRLSDYIEYNNEISIGNQRRSRKNIVKIRLDKEKYNIDSKIDDAIINGKSIEKEIVANDKFVIETNIPF